MTAELVYIDAMKRFEEMGVNENVYQLKLANGDDIIAIQHLDTWVNPVKINYMQDRHGKIQVMLNAWFLTTEQFYYVDIADQCVIAKYLVGRGMTEYYKHVNDLFTNAADEGDLAIPTSNNTTKKYTAPDLEERISKAIDEGRFFPFSNTYNISH